MTDVRAHDAKTRLPKLLERVEKGERFLITRHGKPVAALVPVAARDTAAIDERSAAADALIDELERATAVVPAIWPYEIANAHRYSSIWPRAIAARR